MAWRSLTSIERSEATLVFPEALDLDRVRVAEDARWTNAFPRLWARLRRRERPAYDNAITLGHRICFPRPLATTPQDLADGRWSDFGWLVHELTHVWQAERIGPRYLWRALRAQVRDGDDVYDYGGEDGLREATLSGLGLAGFTVEQQAELARDYYLRRRRGADVEAWAPIVAKLSAS